MRARYLKPSVTDYDSLNGEGVMPLAAIGLGKAAIALAAGYAAGRAVAKASGARPSFKMPSLNSYRGE